MNIVKLKDVIMPEEFKMSEFFNTKLKGKYAYWIQMRYIFPLDSLCYGEYIKYEQKDPMDFLSDKTKPHIDLYSEEYCMIDFVNLFIDLCETEEVNNVYKYIAANEYSTDPDIDINALRNFRTWLATELLRLNSGLYDDHLGKYTDEQVHMLEYYKNGMYNDIVKYLNIFGNKEPYISNAKTNLTGCGCSNNYNTNNIMSISAISTCDAKSIYTDNIHALMVKTFEDPKFWMSINTNFIKVFKKYIDNIIKVGLTIETSFDKNPFEECSCLENTKSNNTKILERLSVSLGYIIDKSTDGHMNYIHDALYEWSEYLYEKMNWQIR